MDDDAPDLEEIRRLVADNEHVFELKDDILELCDSFELDDIEKAMMMAVTDVYMNLCISREDSMDRMSTFAVKVIAAIMLFDENGVPNWHKKQ